LIAIYRATQWVEMLNSEWSFVKIDKPDASTEENNDHRRQAEYDPDRAGTLIGGSALRMRLDVSHALGFDRLALTKIRTKSA